MVVRSGGEGVYVFGSFQLDPARRVLSHDNLPVNLRPTVFDVLLCLVENPGRIVEKSELFDAVWPGRTVEESNLSQTVFWLRAALVERGGDAAKRLILTARGRGYRFTGQVRWEPRAAASEAPGGPPPDPIAEPRRAPLNRRWVIAAGVAALAVACAGLAVWRFWPAAAATSNTVVLTDFQNRTHQAIFDRTLSNVLRIDLGQSPYVLVMPEKDERDTMALMTKPRDAPITMALADEICVRNNADAVLDGAIDAIGSGYVVTLTATDCSGQHVLAAEKADVASADGVMAALDNLLAEVRGKLGEPIVSIGRFNVPLAPEKTASLEALKAFSEGSWLMDHGRREEATPLFSHAIDLDPNFAGAYVSLAVTYAGTNEDELAAAAITRAYQLRDTLNERQKLAVVNLYNQFATHDLNESIRTLELSTSIYPTDARAWANLANLENVLGRYDQAVMYGARGVALHPAAETPYVVLARAYLRSGRPDQALAVASQAVAQGLAGEATHGVMLAADYMRHDVAGVQQEMWWASGKPAERSLLYIEGQIAYAEGKVREGDVLFDHSAELAQQQGVPDAARAYRARLLIDLGLPDKARPLLATVTDKDDDDFIFATAEIGDAARAEALIADQLRRYPGGTLIAADFAPEVRAVAALRRSRPADALAALQPAIPYESRTFDIVYLLGRSYLAAGDGARAQAAFQLIRDHEGWYPESPLYSLAELGLARALALQHSVAAARAAYQGFLDGWKDADPDLPLLKAARAEYARLAGARPS